MPGDSHSIDTVNPTIAYKHGILSIRAVFGRKKCSVLEKFTIQDRSEQLLETSRRISEKCRIPRVEIVYEGARVNDEDLSETARMEISGKKRKTAEAARTEKKKAAKSLGGGEREILMGTSPWPESLSSEARKSAEGKFNRRNLTENVPGRENKTRRKQERSGKLPYPQEEFTGRGISASHSHSFVHSLKKAPFVIYREIYKNNFPPVSGRDRDGELCNSRRLQGV